MKWEGEGLGVPSHRDRDGLGVPSHRDRDVRTPRIRPVTEAAAEGISGFEVYEIRHEISAFN